MPERVGASPSIGGLLGVRRAANPTIRDQMAQGLLGYEPSDSLRTLVSGLLGSQGYGTTNVSALDFTPIAGAVANGQEDWRDGNYKGVALSALSAVPAFGSIRGLLAGGGSNVEIGRAHV